MNSNFYSSNQILQQSISNFYTLQFTIKLKPILIPYLRTIPNSSNYHQKQILSSNIAKKHFYEAHINVEHPTHHENTKNV